MERKIPIPQILYRIAVTVNMNNDYKELSVLPVRALIVTVKEGLNFEKKEEGNASIPEETMMADLQWLPYNLSVTHLGDDG